MSIPAAVKPLWTARMYPGTVGRDHLGLGSVSSFQILANLSPGVNVLTFHPRYYSFYVFLLDEFWLQERPRTNHEWIENFYRPRAFIYSVATHLHQIDAQTSLRSIIGGQKVGPLVSEGTQSFDVTYDYIKTRSGGYGLYYRSTMIEIGLVYPGGSGFPYPIDVPSETGKEVAAAYRETIKGTEYYQRYFSKDTGEIPREVVREYGQTASLELLQTSTAKDRLPLLNAFLYGGPDAASRRETFRFFLDIADQTQDVPIDQDEFRQLVYFRKSPRGALYTPRPEIEAVYRRWRLYQMREYYSFALNALWVYLCKWGIENDGHMRPLPLAAFWSHLEQLVDFSELGQWFDLPTASLKLDSDFQTLLAWIKQAVGTTSTESFDLHCDLSSPLHEHRLYQAALANQSSPTIMVAGMIAILAVIYLRVGYPARWMEADWGIACMGSDGRLSVDKFVRALRSKSSSGSLSLRQVIRWLYEDYVILQHTLVASGKLPDNTFRFRRDGHRLSFFDLNTTLVFNDSRFDALSTTVHELGLCGNFGTSGHGLTPDGEKLLLEGNLP
jgi:hypothetical protein